MSREDDLALLHQYTDSDSLIKHMLAVEAACPGPARTLGGMGNMGRLAPGQVY